MHRLTSRIAHLERKRPGPRPLVPLPPENRAAFMRLVDDCCTWWPDLLDIPDTWERIEEAMRRLDDPEARGLRQRPLGE